MNKLKELTNKVGYENACLILEVDKLVSKVDRKFSLSQEDKEYYYGRVEDYRAGIRYDFKNWEAIKYIVWTWTFKLKMCVVKQTAKTAIKRKTEEA